MNLMLPYNPNPLLCSSTSLAQLSPKAVLYNFNLPTKHRPKISRKNPNSLVKASANLNGSDGFSWVSLTQSIRCGSEQFWSNFGESVKKETGFDLKDVNVKVGEYLGQAAEGLKRGGTELERFKTDLVPEFVSWNQWER